MIDKEIPLWADGWVKPDHIVDGSEEHTIWKLKYASEEHWCETMLYLIAAMEEKLD